MNWQKGWMRLVVPVAIGVTVGLMAVSLVLAVGQGVFMIRDALWPLAMALLLAYVFDPLVTWAQRHWRWPRLLSTTILFAVGTACFALLLVWLMPKLIYQVVQFRSYLPTLVQGISNWWTRHQHMLGGAPGAATQPEQNFLQQLAIILQADGQTSLVSVAQRIVAYATRGLQALFYVCNLLILVPLYTFVFLWKFDKLRTWTAGWLPVRHRPRILAIVAKMDVAVSAFFRGRLIICIVVGALTAAAWSAIGLRFGLILGLLVGVLNLVPFMAILLGLPIALLVAGLAGPTGTELLWLLFLTTLTFSIFQALDQFVLTPAIQGRAVGLHPVTIIVVLLIGGLLLGLLGLLLAVPTAAAVKILGIEWLGPRLRRLIHT